MGQPRPSRAATGDFTNGSTTVSNVNLSLTERGQVSRFITGPDGKPYMVTKIPDASTLVIDREYDSEGRIKDFIFTGKGWGHGVGLCQVGAFGMARSGAAYMDILQKYYEGITIDKIY